MALWKKLKQKHTAQPITNEVDSMIPQVMGQQMHGAFNVAKTPAPMPNAVQQNQTAMAAKKTSNLPAWAQLTAQQRLDREARKQRMAQPGGMRSEDEFHMAAQKGAQQQAAERAYQATKPPAPVKPPVPAKPPVTPFKPTWLTTPGIKKGMSADHAKFYETYTKNLQQGIADPAALITYNTLAKKYGLKKGSISTEVMKQMSVRALSGDKKAQAYLKAFGLKAFNGEKLYKGYTDPSKLTPQQRQEYFKYNPTSQYTEDYDKRQFDLYNEKIRNDEPLTKLERDWYNKMIQKWGYEDHNDPLVQQKWQQEKDKQAALDAQDSNLNNSMAILDSNNFQKFQQLQQDMSARGMGDSGIASDAYTRLQMGANRDYQDAFIQGQQNKADIQAEYTDKRGQIDEKIFANKRAAEQAKAEMDFAYAEMEQKAMTEQQKMQFEKDKFLSQQSGYLYMNGKPLMMGGKPLTTIELMKLSETKRANIAKENGISQKNQLDFILGTDRNAIARDKNAIDAQGNQLDYALGMDRNQVDRMRIQAEMEKAAASMKLGYAKLDMGYAKIEADFNKTTAQLDIAARNSATSEQKNMITGVSNQIKALQAQIKAQKGGKATKKQKEQLKGLMNKMDGILSGKV